MRKMSSLPHACALLSAIAVAAAPAEAGRRPDQNAVFDARRQGAILPFPMLEKRAFKFQRGVSVIWVDIDGRTGRELGRTGD